MRAASVESRVESDMVGNYRGFGAAWLVVCLWLAQAAGAAPVTLGNLGLDPSDAWRRGDAMEEAEMASIVLRDAGTASLEVYLPLRRSRLKNDEAEFFSRLEQGWQRRYGDQAELGWLETGGKRWRVCRRPSRDGAGQVYEIVAVHGGEAYELIALAPKEADVLPESVRGLLSGASWQGVLPDATAAESRPAVPERRWYLLRSVTVVPSGPAWEELAMAEANRIGVGGLVKGLGMSATPAGIEGFLEGFVWKGSEGAGEYRMPFRREWRIGWPSVPDVWPGGEALNLELLMSETHAGLPVSRNLGVDFQVAAVCAPEARLTHWLDGLEALGVAALPDIDAMSCRSGATGPDPVSVAMPPDETEYRGSAVLRLPSAWERDIPSHAADDVGRLVVILRFRFSDTGGEPGDAMLGRAAAVFVFGPEV